MKKSIKIAIAGLLMVPALALASMLVTPSSAYADDSFIQQGVDSIGGATTKCLFTGVDGCQSGVFTDIVNTAMFIIGALSVLMLIYGGIRYTISMGDAKNVEAAKNTIMYAIIGIIVALLSFAIVNFVLGKLIA